AGSGGAVGHTRSSARCTSGATPWSRARSTTSGQSVSASARVVIRSRSALQRRVRAQARIRSTPPEYTRPGAPHTHFPVAPRVVAAYKREWLETHTGRWLEGVWRSGAQPEGTWIALSGVSMAPALRDGDRLRVTPLAGAGRPLELGEVVV